MIFWDHKVTSVWKYIKADYIDWEAQLNLSAAIARRSTDREVTRLQVFAMFKDWNRRRAEREEDYPNLPFKVIPIRMWNPEKAEEVLVRRVGMHKEAKGLPDEGLPFCTDYERWYTGDQWAVHRQGRKAALKLCATKAEAEEYIAQRKLSAYVEHRPGIYRRCEKYCIARTVCHQWRKQRGV